MGTRSGALHRVWRIASIAFLLLLASLAGCLGTGRGDEPLPPGGPGASAGPVGPMDNSTPGTQAQASGPAASRPVVVAVVDFQFNPYHWDFLAQHMPQHLDGDPADDLPLGEDPAAWLPGHPGAAAFASHTRLDLNLTPDLSGADPRDLHDADKKQWGKVKVSTPDEIHMHWIPGTKVVGFVNFAGGDGFAASSHGTRSSSVAMGNLHGSCPECVFVFVNGFLEKSTEWVLKQDWIDVQVNSWGQSSIHTEEFRDRVYAGSDTELQRLASERGQAVFFSAGNGPRNDQLAPNPTLWSSQEGPDWIYTVGAINPAGESYSGHGKPADVASVGDDYPSMGGDSVTDEGSFDGTSNANAVVAGIYARALWLLRDELGAKRSQDDGVLAVAGTGGKAWLGGCRTANPACALGDGVLRVEELREAFLRSAAYTPAGWTAGTTGHPVPAETDEMRLSAEGHGSFWGRLADDWQAESQRVAAYARGDWHGAQDSDQQAWMVALSWCTQKLWGEWGGGYWDPNATLPPPDPQWPARTWLVEECPRSGKLLRDALGF